MSSQELLEQVEALKESVRQLTNQAHSNGQCACTNEMRCSFHAYVQNRLQETATKLSHLAAYIYRETNT